MSDLEKKHQVDTDTILKEPLVWVSQTVKYACLEEATARYPYETGGTFMGWWSDPHTAVITAMIGPGPHAKHERHSFEPDQLWQLKKIAEHYAASGRRETYLGDWHSHPGALDGTLSLADRRVLRRIIMAPLARCTNPLMIVTWGGRGSWELSTWSAELQPRSLLWDRLMLYNATVKTYTT